MVVTGETTAKLYATGYVPPFQVASAQVPMIITTSAAPAGREYLTVEKANPQLLEEVKEGHRDLL